MPITTASPTDERRQLPVGFPLLALLVTTAGTAALVTVMRLGGSWPVICTAAAGIGMTYWLRGASVRRAMTAFLVVGLAGLFIIEAVNVFQYGTMSLTGPPTTIRWCGDSYRPSGSVTHGLGNGDGPPFAQLLTTPAAYSVYGTYRPGFSCGATGPLLVELHPRVYAVYNP